MKTEKDTDAGSNKLLAINTDPKNLAPLEKKGTDSKEADSELLAALITTQALNKAAQVEPPPTPVLRPLTRSSYYCIKALRGLAKILKFFLDMRGDERTPRR